MKSIKNEVVIELVISKSTFINYLIPVSNIEDVNNELKILREKYSDANHHCFAYILGENQSIQKYSDDGEPSKTAGLPMIEVLKKHDLTNVLNVSVRYFGGIKLGAGGLVRAYTKGCASSIVEAEFTSLCTFNKIEVIISFDMIGNIEKYIRDTYKLLNQTYDTKVHYFIDVEADKYDILLDYIQQKTNGRSEIIILNTFNKYV